MDETETETEPQLVGSCADSRAFANAEIVDPVLGSLVADVAVGIMLDDDCDRLPADCGGCERQRVTHAWIPHR